MKKNLLLIMMCIPATLPAQNGVTVSNLAVNAGTVTFNVNWQTPMPVSPWSDSVWVFVDYNKAGMMKRLPLTPGATLTATSAPGTGRVVQYDDNNKGVWVVGNARINGGFSATVQLLTTVNEIAGACAYASNYPPVGEYKTANVIEFTGTPIYDIILKDGSGATSTWQSSGQFTVPAGYTAQSFTDKTGAPGKIKCLAPATFTLTASAAGFCTGDAGVVFALSGTEAERHYQLFKNNLAVVDAILDGTGNAATFTGSFNAAGTYTVRTVADDLYCATSMDGIHVVVENPLPVISDVNSASRQCAGTVTLGVSSPGAVIDWYADAAATLTLLTGASYTTPEIRTSMTYYAQARIAETGCLSARIPVLAEVITEGCCHAPGVTNIIFAEFNPCSGAPYASTYTLTDDRDQKNYIIKYMPDGRYWMIQDLKFGNCSVSSGKSDDSETATKNAPTVYDGYVGHCAAATTTNSPSDISYFYSWAAAMNNSKAYKGSNESTFACSGTGSSTKNCQGICPKGWHIPTPDEYADANSKFTTFFNCSNFSCWGSGSEWSGTLPGCLTCSNASIWNASYTHYWTSGSSDANNAKCHISSTSGVWINSGCIKCDYMHVRCIRNYDNY